MVEKYSQEWPSIYLFCKESTFKWIRKYEGPDSQMGTGHEQAVHKRRKHSTTVIKKCKLIQQNTFFHFCKTFWVILLHVNGVEMKLRTDTFMLLVIYKLTQFYRKAVWRCFNGPKIVYTHWS